MTRYSSIMASLIAIALTVLFSAPLIRLVPPPLSTLVQALAFGVIASLPLLPWIRELAFAVATTVSFTVMVFGYADEMVYVPPEARPLFAFAFLIVGGIASAVAYVLHSLVSRILFLLK